MNFLFVLTMANLSFRLYGFSHFFGYAMRSRPWAQSLLKVVVAGLLLTAAIGKLFEWLGRDSSKGYLEYDLTLLWLIVDFVAAFAVVGFWGRSRILPSAIFGVFSVFAIFHLFSQGQDCGCFGVFPLPRIFVFWLDATVLALIFIVNWVEMRPPSRRQFRLEIASLMAIAIIATSIARLDGSKQRCQGLVEAAILKVVTNNPTQFTGNTLIVFGNVRCPDCRNIMETVAQMRRVDRWVCVAVTNELTISAPGVELSGFDTCLGLPTLGKLPHCRDPIMFELVNGTLGRCFLNPKSEKQ